MKSGLRLALLIAGLVVGVPAAFAGDVPLDGMYAAEGFNPDGSEYKALVKITRHGDSFLVAWLFPERDDEAIVVVLKSAGVGVVHGGMLAVSYYGQDLTGVVLYQIEEGGRRLEGRRVAAGADGAIRSETLRRLPEPDSVPESGTPVPSLPRKPIRTSVRARTAPGNGAR